MYTMRIHADFIEDFDGDLVEVNSYCGELCYSDDTGQSAFGQAYPCGSETDYDVYCASCNELLWHGTEEN